MDKLPQPESHTGVVFSREEILSLLISGSWNWYELVAVAEESGVELSTLESEYAHILPLISEQAQRLLTQSHAAYLETEKTDTPIVKLMLLMETLFLNRIVTIQMIM